MVIGRAKAWTEKDFSFDITGGIDWMDNVAQQVAEFWQDVDQDTILAILKGIFSMTGGQSAEFVTKHTYEVAGNMEAIRGLWVVAEGLIYTMFNRDFHVVPDVPRPYDRYYISVDYGTINPTSMGLWGRAAGKWYRIREYYFDSRKVGRQLTDEEHYTGLEKLAGDLSIRAVIVDPSAASFIETIRRHGRFYVEKASNSVLDGIRDVATRLQSGDIFFCECCTDCIREFGLYRWDEKAPMDRPIKENDHAMDDVRYFVHKIFAPEIFSF